MPVNIIFKYFPTLSDVQKQQFESFGALCVTWNDRINLISRKDIMYMQDRHVLHSLAIARCTEFLPEQTVLDVGTGGGLPGIPLAIMFPQTQFVLIDSVRKKIIAVDDMIQALALKNVTTRRMRAEQLAGDERFDFVVCRAVAPMPELMQWTWKITRNGAVCLKGGDVATEIAAARHIIKSADVNIYNISEWFDEPFFETKKVVCIKKQTT
jgi:16S rRNA (guanine527-N7)-methyltransferase